MAASGPRSPEAPREDARVERRLARLVAARLVLLLALFVAALALEGRGDAEPAARDGLYAALATAFLSSVVFAVLLPRIRRAGTFGALLIPTDAVLVTALVHFSGGDESLFGFLYPLVAVFGAVVADRRGAFAAAGLCASLHGAVLLAAARGWLPDYGAPHAPEPVLLAFWSVHTAALVVVALLASHLSREVRAADARLDQSQSHLARLRRLHERIVESLMSGLLTTDPSGRVTSFNREAERITGVAVAAALGRDVDEVIPGVQERAVARAMAGAPLAKLRERMAYRNRRGEDLHLGLSASVLRDEDGAVAGTVVIFQDVTRVVEMEAELRRSERLAAAGKLAADIAHEVRNPLAAISGSIQMLLAGDGGEDARGERARLSDIVLRETDRLNGLITDFLQYAHPRAPRLEPLALAGAVDEVLQMLEHAAGPDVKVETRVAPDLRVLADPAQLRQLLWNLCLNAVQAMPAGGALRVAARRLAPGAPQGGVGDVRNVATEEGTERVEICVSDTGAGIPPESLDRIFDPFFTTRADGTGLGLATVHRIVEAHGGSLRVESVPGAGTTFSIELRGAREER
jgi:two-component system sensor histidine kinase PilS (NtrC family)